MNCICITAYKSPEMLSDLLDAMQDDFLCFVHIDKKAWGSFNEVVKSHPKVHFYSKYSIVWGGYEHLDAILYLLRKALKYEWNYVHIISGEDYPVVSNDTLYDFFQDKNKTYISFELVTSKKHSINRRYRYFWPYTKFSWNYKNKMIRYISLFIIALQYFVINRNRIGQLKNIYYGFIWGDYHRKAIECILHYFDKHPEFINDLKWCKIPEEFAFQTILLNDKSQSKLVVNQTLRFWNWSRGDKSGPSYIIMNDISELLESSALFARKLKHNSSELDAIIELRKNRTINL